MFIVTECLHCGGKQYVGIEQRKMFPYYILDEIAEQPCPICLNNHGNYAALLMLFQNRKMNNYAETDEMNTEQFDNLTDFEKIIILASKEYGMTIDEIMMWLDEL